MLARNAFHRIRALRPHVWPVLIASLVVCCKQGRNERGAPTRPEGTAPSAGGAAATPIDTASGGTPTPPFDAGLSHRDAAAVTPTRPSPNALVGLMHGTCALDGAGGLHCWSQLDAEWSLPTGPFVSLYGEDDVICGFREGGKVECGAHHVYMVGPTPMFDGMMLSVAVSGNLLASIDVNGEPSLRDRRAGNWALPPGTKLRTITAGGYFACGILEDDAALACFREPVAGQPIADPRGAAAPPAGQFLSISTNSLTSCGIRVDGTLACWGVGGPEDPEESRNFGQGLPPEGTFTQVDMSPFHGCALRDDGEVICWGEALQKDLCEKAPPPGPFVQIATSDFHACAMRADRSIECWGCTNGGRLNPPDLR